MSMHATIDTRSPTVPLHSTTTTLEQLVQTGDEHNEANAFYVDGAACKKILAACPDDEWRLIFALCRFGGLRCPSEIWRLTCEDLTSDRFTVHGKGKKERVVPIFERLRPHLEAVAKLKKTGPLVSKGRRSITATALRWQFERIVTRAGLEQWPRLFHNLRASCETDLAGEGFRPHVYSKWLGNSEHVARKHYLQPTPEDFERATGAKDGKKKRA